MGLLQDMIQNIKEKRQREQELREEMPDDMTRDKYLRSLRRQHREINEEKEKVILKQRISEHYKQKLQESMVFKGENKQRNIPKKPKKQTWFHKHKL